MPDGTKARPDPEKTGAGAEVEMRASAFHCWSVQQRIQNLQLYVRPNDVFLEFGARDLSNLSGLKAGQKLVVLRADTSLTASEKGINIVSFWGEVSPESVDVALCDQVLEYLINPIATVMELMRVLKSGGRLIVDALYDPNFIDPKAQPSGEHFFSWNVQTLGNLVNDCGFTVEAGTVQRKPNPSVAARWGSRFGNTPFAFRLASAVARRSAPEFTVRIIARKA